jgi:hypothetical protein
VLVLNMRLATHCCNCFHLWMLLRLPAASSCCACRSVVKHLVGLAQFGGPRATPEQLALVLNGYGPVCVSGEGDAAAGAAAAQEQVRGLLERMVQQREREEQGESSDFDD